jgi:hypothetical protein
VFASEYELASEKTSARTSEKKATFISIYLMDNTERGGAKRRLHFYLSIDIYLNTETFISI